jgi:hypothetical protein
LSAVAITAASAQANSLRSPSVLLPPSLAGVDWISTKATN